MADVDWVNSTLKALMNCGEYDSYKPLIEAVIKNDEASDAKYYLVAMLYDLSAERHHVEHLKKFVKNIFSKETDIDAYLDKLISCNPKFGTISISASHQLDMTHSHNLFIEVPAHFNKTREEVEAQINRIKEVLKMILLESKTVI